MLDSTAAAALAEQYTATFMDPADAFLSTDDPDWRAKYIAVKTAEYEMLFDAIKQNAIVMPAGVPTPMSNSGGPVVGTGKIT